MRLQGLPAVCCLLLLGLCRSDGIIQCNYYGLGWTRGIERLVEDVCPPPANNGLYYFTIDIDPGLASSTTMRGQLTSPASANCTGNLCTSTIAPGYDLYIGKNCLPVPTAKGSSIGGTAPNERNATTKEIVLSVNTYTRYYLGLRKKPFIEAGDESCSFFLLPGITEGDSSDGIVCSINDYDRAKGIDFCVDRLGVFAKDPWLIAVAIVGGIFLSVIVFMILRWREKRKQLLQMVNETEDMFRVALSDTANKKNVAIKNGVIDVDAANQFRRANKVAPGSPASGNNASSAPWAGKRSTALDSRIPTAEIP